MANAAFKFLFHSPVAMLTAVQEVFEVETDWVRAESTSGYFF